MAERAARAAGFFRRIAGAFDKVDDCGGFVHKLAAGGAGALHILAPELGVLEQVAAAVTAHKGHIEPPAGQPDEGHIEQFVLEKEFGNRQPGAEQIANDDDVGPAQVIADNQVPSCGIEMAVVLNLPFDTVGQAQHQGITA